MALGNLPYTDSPRVRGFLTLSRRPDLNWDKPFVAHLAEIAPTLGPYKMRPSSL